MTQPESLRTAGLAPLLALVLAAPVPLSIGALLSDWAYSSSYQIQWINFADWLVAGSLVFAGIAIAGSLLRLALHRQWRSRADGLTLVVLALFFIFQFINALTHSKDAYATMPAGLILSVIATILSVAATWLGLSNLMKGDVR